MARDILKQSKNFTKRDSINSRNGEALSLLNDNQTIVVGASCIMNTIDESTGEITPCGVIVSDEKHYYTTISGTIIDVLPDLIDILDEEEAVEVRINKRKSKAGRDFLTLTIL